MRRVVGAALAAWLAMSLPAAAEVHDSLPDMITAWVAIQEDPSPPWEAAWLRYEAAQSSWLDHTLYAGRTPAQKGQQIDAALHDGDSGFPTQMSQLAAFEESWGGDLTAVNEGLQREFGQVPVVELYLAYAMAPARLAIGELNGKPSMCVNARRLLPYRSAPTRVLLARYLFEWVLTRWQRGNPATIADRLHLDGLCVWGAGRVLPGVPDEELLDVTGTQLGQLEANRTQYAAALLSALDAHDPTLTKRFFGQDPPPGWPPAVGAYIGMLVARDLAQQVGQSELPKLAHGAYVAQARRSLARLAATHS